MVKKLKRIYFQKPSDDVSQRMRRIKSSGSSIEKIMARILRARKIKYRTQLNLPGRPDFRLIGKNVLIFCDSSFWHGRRHKEITGKAFSKNKTFWINKLLDNKKRDVRINRKLKKGGWKVLRFWDTDIIKSPNKIIKKLEKCLNEEKIYGN